MTARPKPLELDTRAGKFVASTLESSAAVIARTTPTGGLENLFSTRIR